nr:immunoglobulin heavy chain junction region [Macaca mulatta]
CARSHVFSGLLLDYW